LRPFVGPHATGDPIESAGNVLAGRNV
jgi:hypothetical protein